MTKKKTLKMLCEETIIFAGTIRSINAASRCLNDLKQTISCQRNLIKDKIKINILSL